MTDMRQGEVAISEEVDIVAVRKAVRGASAAGGFGVTDVTRIVTSASELARNVYVYAGSGVLRWRLLNADGRSGIELTFEDQGPGIADVDQAMEVGYTTSGGLGMGLPGSKRLMGEMEVRSEVGSGTRVTVRKWLAR